MCIYESERVGDGRECESRGWQRESTTMEERERVGDGGEKLGSGRGSGRGRERGGMGVCV